MITMSTTLEAETIQKMYGIPAEIVIDSGGKWREQVRAREAECFRIYNFMEI